MKGLKEAAIMHHKDVMEYEVKTGLKIPNMTSFKAGANWHRESIWHDASEEPDIDERIVIYDYGLIISTTRRNVLYGCKKWNPEKWCYLSDILPIKK